MVLVLHRGGGSCFSFFGLLPPWRLRASLAASCPNIWFFKDGACSRGGRVGYSSGCNIWGASCGCLLDRGQDGTFFCSSLAHALGLSRQASESLLLSQKGVWRELQKRSLYQGACRARRGWFVGGLNDPTLQRNTKHVGNRRGASPPPPPPPDLFTVWSPKLGWSDGHADKSFAQGFPQLLAPLFAVEPADSPTTEFGPAWSNSHIADCKLDRPGPTYKSTICKLARAGPTYTNRQCGIWANHGTR